MEQNLTVSRPSERFPGRCQICGGSGQPAFIAGLYKMYRCQQCKTAFCAPQPTDSELKSFYSQFHRSEDESGWYDEAELRMQQDFPAKLALVNRTTSGNAGKVLAVGCGKGFF